MHILNRETEKLSMSVRGAKQFAKVGMPVVLFCCGGMLMLKQVSFYASIINLFHSNEFLFSKRLTRDDRRSSSTESWSYRVNVRRVDRRGKLNLRMSITK